MAEKQHSFAGIVGAEDESVILAEILRLENSVAHLVLSNREMVIARTTDPDPIYSKSISENEGLIVRQRMRIEELKRKLDRIPHIPRAIPPSPLQSPQDTATSAPMGMPPFM